MKAEIEALCERLEAPLGVFGMQEMLNHCHKAATMLRALADENERLKLQRDEAREQFDKHVAWASDQQAAAEARAIAAEEALNAIIDRGPERDQKWAGMTAKDIARAALAQKEGG